MPAFAKTTSSRPKRSTAAWTAAVICSALVTSAASARTCSAGSVLATASTLSWARSTRVTCAPRATSARVVADPIPPLAPVTRIDLPEMSYWVMRRPGSWFSESGVVFDGGALDGPRRVVQDGAQQLVLREVDHPMHLRAIRGGLHDRLRDVADGEVDADRVDDRALCGLHHRRVDEVGQDVADMDAQGLPLDVHDQLLTIADRVVLVRIALRFTATIFDGTNGSAPVNPAPLCASARSCAAM